MHKMFVKARWYYIIILFWALWMVCLQKHNMGNCSITCDGITTPRLPREMCVHMKKEHTLTCTGLMLSAIALCCSHMGFQIWVLQVHTPPIRVYSRLPSDRETDEVEEEGRWGSLPSGFCCTGCSLHGNMAFPRAIKSRIEIGPCPPPLVCMQLLLLSTKPHPF